VDEFLLRKEIMFAPTFKDVADLQKMGFKKCFFKLPNAFCAV